jgi:hypothetical protein
MAFAIARKGFLPTGNRKANSAIRQMLNLGNDFVENQIGSFELNVHYFVANLILDRRL